jgi:hypothetical protein
MEWIIGFGVYVIVVSLIFAFMIGSSRKDNELRCVVCSGGGCTNCAPQNETLQFASGKEIDEFYDTYGETMYVDPAESTPDEVR